MDAEAVTDFAAGCFFDALGRHPNTSSLAGCTEWLREFDGEDLRLVRLGVETLGSGCSGNWLHEELGDDTELLKLVVWDAARHLSQVEIPCVDGDEHRG